ncbi:Planctomycete cytochrome C [Granulicella pectinivorans]|uniref:Planctomycete cytochrome C n=1 Tax=Granulicella pectinivorans TaxID=474950 RepID=A0A1I6M698_9BACT|nr:c-type cytochrome domain-containing protein [Granulicella pectinivorans]SFS11143.1 Planctomycete cytochrome C [Granulicella pectinivorans]
MRSLFVGLTVAALLTLALKPMTHVEAGEDKAREEFYTKRVKPIFDATCARCHGGVNHRGGLNMDTRESLLKGGRDGAVIVPGDPAKSVLITLIRHEGPKDEPRNMPPKGDKLSDADIRTIEDWIRAGAVMPEAAK